MKQFLVILLLLSQLVLTAGNKSKTLKLSIKDTSGEPLVGAKVTLENSNELLYTDFDGVVFINKNKAQSTTLNVSMVSYENKTIQLPKSNNDLSIQLKSK